VSENETRDMIFIWTSNGGQLQYVAIFLLVLVQLLPNLIYLQDEERLSSDYTSRDHTDSLSSSSSPTSSSLKSIALAFIILFVVLAAIVIANLNHLREWSRRSDRRIHLAVLGFASGVVLCFLWFFYLPTTSSASNSLYESFEDAYLLFAILTQVGGFIWMLQQFFSNNPNFAFPTRNNNINNNNQQTNSAKMARIVAKIHAMPIEEFAKDDPNSYASLKVARLQQMLRIRGDHEKYLERSELVSALKQCRKYSDSCCICCEDYAEGEDTLRVLPKCHHEFHLECLDQWAYTFQNKANLPTCPLCKESL
jgi:flagellar biogenesis protein FliO